MPENIKALRRRIRSVSNTRKITRTMEMISASKLRKIEGAMASARPYAAKIRELVAHLAASEAAQDQPLFQVRPAERVAAVVVAGDRGLCGAYNSSILKYAGRQMEIEARGAELKTVAVGKRSAQFMRKGGYDVLLSEIDLGGEVSIDLANRIADRLVDMFLDGEIDRVLLIYNQPVSATTYRPTMDVFLPLTPTELLGGEGDGGAGDEVFHKSVEYIFEPSARDVFADLMPRYIQTRVYQSLLEAMVAEHSARRIAMNNATENCDDLIDSLTLRMNKARQAAITTEINEIVAGAEALLG